MWCIVPSSSGVPFYPVWGLPNDTPMTVDFDGDGKMDIVTWRPSDGTWNVVLSGSGKVYSVQLGISSDLPLTKSPS
jgi:FG-GAP repeat